MRANSDEISCVLSQLRIDLISRMICSASYFTHPAR